MAIQIFGFCISPSLCHSVKQDSVVYIYIIFWSSKCKYRSKDNFDWHFSSEPHLLWERVHKLMDFAFTVFAGSWQITVTECTWSPHCMNLVERWVGILLMMYRNENAEILYEPYLLLTNILKGYYISVTQLKIDGYSSSSARTCLGLWCFTLSWLLFIFHDKKANQPEIIMWIICIVTQHKMYLEIKHWPHLSYQTLVLSQFYTDESGKHCPFYD